MDTAPDTMPRCKRCKHRYTDTVPCWCHRRFCTCYATFVPKNKHQEYCSPSCRKKAKDVREKCKRYARFDALYGTFDRFRPV